MGRARIEDIKAGQKYRIRQWEDMASDCSYADEDFIRFKDDSVFVNAMREFCGRSFTVRSTMNYHQAIIINPDDPAFTHWVITSEMIEPFQEIIPFEENEINVLLGI